MKRLLSVLLSITLVLGLSVGVQLTPVKADGTINNCLPANGQTINLLSDYVYDFCANYTRDAAKQYYKKGSNRYAPTPARLAWDAVSGASSYTVEISTNSDLSGAKSHTATTNMIDIEDLFAGYTYYYRVSTSVSGTSYVSAVNTFKTANLPRTCSIDGVNNSRDIGGCYTSTGQRVFQGKIYRGARLDQIKETGKKKMLEVYGIKTDLDLREASKVPATPPLGNTVNLINISAPQYLGNPTSSNELGGFDRASNWPVVKKEMEVFANASNYPIYVHCNIGRDRTGSILFLLEALLGMSENDIYRDYDLSYFASLSSEKITDPSLFNSVNIDTLVNYIKNYSTGNLQQNTEAYLKKSVGLTDAQISQIKGNLLSAAPKTTPAKPGKVKIKSAKNSKKKAVVVKFKKVKGAVGYQVWWSKNKKFKKGTKKKFTKKTKYTIKKLKKKKTYYIKVRAYNMNGNKKQFGLFSKIKKVKIKK